MKKFLVICCLFIGFLAFPYSSFAATILQNFTNDGTQPYPFGSFPTNYGAMQFTLNQSATIGSFSIAANDSIGGVYCGSGDIYNSSNTRVQLMNATTSSNATFGTYTIYSTSTPIELSAGTYTILFGCNSGNRPWYGNSIDISSSFAMGRTSIGSPHGSFSADGDKIEPVFRMCTESTCELTEDLTFQNTQITTVDPPDKSTIATTSAATFTVTGYIHPNDLTDGTQVYIWTLPNASWVTPNLSIYDSEIFNIDIDEAGPFSTSTVLTLPYTGEWRIYTSITNPRFSVLGFNVLTKTLVSTTTVFVNGIQSYYDTAGEEIDAIVTEAFNATSTSALTDSCGIFSGDSVWKCLIALFIPSQAQISDLLTDFNQNIATVFPFGYVTRFMEIVTNNATSTLPALAITIPAEMTGMEATLDLTPWNYLSTGNSMLATATTTYGDNPGQTFRDVVEPGWELLLNVFLILLVAGTIFGFKVPKFL